MLSPSPFKPRLCCKLISVLMYSFVHSAPRLRLRLVAIRNALGISFSSRSYHFFGFLFCCVVLLIAYYLQYILELQPCPLCVFQRMFFMISGVLFLLAVLQNPGLVGMRVYASLNLIIASLGLFTAARHVWLQLYPPVEQHTCVPDMHYLLNSFPLTKVFEFLFAGTGECAKMEWQFLGFSVPAWSFVCFSVLIIFSVIQLTRKTSSNG